GEIDIDAVRAAAYTGDIPMAGDNLLPFFQQVDQLPLNEVSDRFFDVENRTPLPQDPVGIDMIYFAGLATQGGKCLGERSGVEARPEELQHGFTMMPDGFLSEPVASIGGIQPPVLFQFPHEEAEDAGDQPDCGPDHGRRL